MGMPRDNPSQQHILTNRVYTWWNGRENTMLSVDGFEAAGKLSNIFLGDALLQTNNKTAPYRPAYSPSSVLLDTKKDQQALPGMTSGTS